MELPPNKLRALCEADLPAFSVGGLWKGAVLSQPTWPRRCLQEACRISSKCWEKTKEPILAKEPEEIPLPCVLLYLPLPLAPSSEGKPKGQLHL
jgi:hypothetical protein